MGQFFDNLSMRAKLFWLSGITGGLLMAAIVFTLWQVNNLRGNVRMIADEALPGIEVAGQLSQLRLRYRVRSLEWLLADTEATRGKVEQSLAGLSKELGDAVVRYRDQVKSDDDLVLLQQVGERIQAYEAAVTQAITLGRQGDEAGARRLSETLWLERANALRDAIDALVSHNREDGERGAEEVYEAVRGLVTWNVGIVLLSTLAAIFVTVVMAARIGSRLARTVGTVEAIAAGDLTAQLPPPAEDELGQLTRAMAGMQGALRQSMASLRESADQVASSARQLKESAAQIGDSTSLQSSAAATIAANIEELSVSINHVSDRTGDASRLAADSDNGARHGKDTVDRLLSGILEVSEVVGSAADQITGMEAQAEGITRIVAVIREIAEQTNLLALNAAIEAARAGEYGRGFAVVADEVRKLSERTAKSTEEITVMVSEVQASTHAAVAGIERGVGAVRENSAKANETGETITRLQGLSQQVAGIVAELDAALREQSMASTEVARRVEEIAAQAEETSSATEQTAAAADSLDAVAGDLLRVVQRFKV